MARRALRERRPGLRRPLRRVVLSVAAAGAAGLALVGVAGCGAGHSVPDAADGSGVEAGADGPAEDVRPDGPRGPGTPEPPEPPRLRDWTCAPGWSPEERLAGSPLAYRICVPPPVELECAPGTMPVLGEAGCQPIGDPCPEGDWPEGLPAGATVLYVRAGATGGDGRSPESPLGSIGAALMRAPPGAVIAIARGRYVEALVLTAPVTLWGACARDTILEAPGPSDQVGTVEIVAAGGVTLRNLQITGDRDGVATHAGARSTLSGVLVDSAQGFGVLQLGDGEIVGSVVRGTRGRNGEIGIGLALIDAAAVTVSRSLIEQNRTFGIVTETGAATGPAPQLTLTDVIVRDTHEEEGTGRLGFGLNVGGGATVRVSRALFERNRTTAISAVTLPGASPPELILEDTVVRDTRSQADNGELGVGLAAGNGASVSVRQSLFLANRTAAISASSSFTSPPVELGLVDVVIEATRARKSDGAAGRGLDVGDAATVSGERLLLLENREVAVLAAATFGPAPELTLNDVVIAATQAQEVGGASGHGLAVQDGARAVLQRARFEENRTAAILVAGPALSAVVRLEASDLAVVGTLSQERDRRFGRGLVVQGRAAARVSRAVFQGNREVAISAGGQAGNSVPELELADVLVEGTLTEASAGNAGDGISLFPATAALRQVRVVGSARAGLSFFGSSSVTLEATVFECNPIPLDREALDGVTGMLEALGEVVCTCEGTSTPCQVQSSNISPPDPIGPLGR